MSLGKIQKYLWRIFDNSFLREVMLLVGIIMMKASLIFKKTSRGFCPLCKNRTIFYAKHLWLREYYRCIHCLSSARNRALVATLERYRPNVENMCILEIGAAGPVTKYFRKHCLNYLESYYHSDEGLGTVINGLRNENCEKLTFDAESFDVVISQEILEHIFDIESALKEIERVLKPGGIHIFTVPVNFSESTTLRRAIKREGIVEFLVEPEYHGNPVPGERSLVTYEYRRDFPYMIFELTGMITHILHYNDSRFGLIGESIEVFVCEKK